jgi:CRISPR-associated protein Csx17
MLPVKYNWKHNSWTIPERAWSRPLRWAGFDPLADFRALLWSRWLDSAELDCLPFAGARTAPLQDIAALLRGDVDLREVHRLAALFALLDWQEQGDQKVLVGSSEESSDAAVVSPAYAALRLWLELGIRPAPDSRPPRDGQVVRLLTIGKPEQVERATALALSRLRVDGLPWDEDPRPTGKAVPQFDVKIRSHEAALLSVAVMVPIADEDKLKLSRRLWVPKK